MSINNEQPVLGITMGDPAGIGPEVLTDLIADTGPPESSSWIVTGDQHLLEKLLPDEIINQSWFTWIEGGVDQRPQSGMILAQDVPGTTWSLDQRGQGTPESGQASLAYLQETYKLIETGLADGIVTGPVSKKAISHSKRPFHGQTEWFAGQMGIKTPVMGMTWKHWLVFTVTRHIPIRKVPLQLTEDRIKQSIQKTNEGLKQYFSMNNPSIGVCGLNPHAGENGLIGREEQDLIAPVLEQLRSDGIDVQGPSSAESLISKPAFQKLDAVLTMFHDQAMVPLKAKGLDNCAAITLGLDTVRTSVAHGTGFELVGTDNYSAESMKRTVRLATTMIHNDKT